MSYPSILTLPRLKSTEDARFQSVRALASRAERDHAGRFFVEGLRFVAQAAAHQAIESVLVVPKTLRPPVRAETPAAA